MDFNITEKYGGHIFHFDVKRDISVLWINIAIHFENNKNEFGTEFMNKSINICKMISGRRHEPVMGIIYEALQEKMSSLPKHCPIKKVCFLILKTFF